MWFIKHVCYIAKLGWIKLDSIKNYLVAKAAEYGKIKIEHLDIDACIADLETKGYLVSGPLLSFLNDVAGISCYIPSKEENKRDRELFNFNPTRGSAGIYKDRILIYEKIALCPLVPIGECDNKHIVLMYGDGAIYGGFDDFLCQYGNNLESSMDMLITGKDVKVLSY